MFETLEIGQGLDIVLALQAGRSEPFNLLANILNALGGELFFLIVMLFVYWSVNRQLGIRLVASLVISLALSLLLKDSFQRPRPYEVSDAVNPLFMEIGYGIPSGHVIMGIVIWGCLALYLRRRWLYGVVAVYIAAQMWSRVYAGVHYPHDVIAGVIFGLPTLWLFDRLSKPTAALWNRLDPPVRALALVLLGVGLALLIGLSGNENWLVAGGLLIGLGPSIELEARYARFTTQDAGSRRYVRAGVGIALTLALFLGLRVLFGVLADEGDTLFAVLRVLRYALVALFAVFILPWLALRVGLADRAA